MENLILKKIEINSVIPDSIDYIYTKEKKKTLFTCGCLTIVLTH